MQYRDVLDKLRAGALSDNEIQAIEKAAAEISERYAE